MKKKWESRCSKCKRKLPSHLLVPMCINGVYTPPICGICALEIRNTSFGFPAGTPFQGEIAQQMYEEALTYDKEEVLT